MSVNLKSYNKFSFSPIPFMTVSTKDVIYVYQINIGNTFDVVELQKSNEAMLNPLQLKQLMPIIKHI